MNRWAVLSNRGYPSFLAALFFNGLSVQVQTVAVGWQLYELTGDPMDLAWVGLSQFLPALALVLITGAAADRFPRRRLMGICLVVMAVISMGFLWLTQAGQLSAGHVFALMALFGAARAFYNPVRQSLAPNLVIARHLPAALALNSSAFKISMIVGPVLGGILYGLAPGLAYAVAGAASLVSVGLVLLVSKPKHSGAPRKQGRDELTAGIRFILAQPILLGAISLDLFVGLVGGAIALLPVYASDILGTDATGLGILRAAPAVGAIMVGGWLASKPITGGAGAKLFWSIAVFGIATVVFALSANLWLSVLALAVLGGADMISVVIRASLVQLNTPDALRGRVNAVNVLFIGASNELGAFRAGSMAAFLGPVVAVAAGGVAALAVCAVYLRLFPSLRHADRLGPD
ncbi:MFS transporter [Salipiger sp. 1_MG-2023]|uniref:MFS transporter n=1 Tax=Salipiger sp. 1_MG-2023 TaxID=3062665 RepID=UPI0026E15DD9|nr:MFS transporter [Salipiger sp. 1_MG-2023]MDO6584716.1 MFS transporter [Salipiger sp. 1_MG-2023]